MSKPKFNPESVHAFTVCLLETYYEDKGEGRVTDAEVEKLRGNDEFIDNDEFVQAYEEWIWTGDNEEKYGDVHYDDRGYFLSDDED